MHLVDSYFCNISREKLRIIRFNYEYHLNACILRKCLSSFSWYVVGKTKVSLKMTSSISLCVHRHETCRLSYTQSLLFCIYFFFGFKLSGEGCLANLLLKCKCKSWWFLWVECVARIHSEKQKQHSNCILAFSISRQVHRVRQVVTKGPRLYN